MSTQTQQRLNQIIAKVRRIELRTRRRSEHQLSGDYHTHFPGQGIDFHEHRLYHHGDDARSLDWNVTARMQEPYIRTFTEDRQRQVLLLVDISGSSSFGTTEANRREFACEVAAHLAFSALDNKDLVGLGLFSSQIERWVEAQRGRQHGLRLLRDILIHQASEAESDLTPVLDQLLKPGIRRSLVFILSDFLLPDFTKSLRLAAQLHEIHCLHLLDPLELKIPKMGKVILEDSETGKFREVDTDSLNFRRSYQSRVHSWQEQVAQQARLSGASLLSLKMGEDPAQALHQYFSAQPHA